MNKIKSIRFKLLVCTIAILSLAVFKVSAQAPLGFNYQGVALTNAGTPVASKKISLRISLLESQQLGTVIYQETHGTNTDAYGQFSIIIGNGQAVTGKMSDVQWNKFPYYMKVELDLDGGTSFVFVGTSQLLSVPYALYANNAGAASISVDSVKNELSTIKLSQKGDSIVLSNNRGSVLIPKIDSISKIASQIAGIKAGTLKYIKDSVSKLPNGIAIGYNALNNFDSTAFNSSNIALGQSAGVALTKLTSGINNSDNILIGQNAAASINAPSTSAGAYQNVIIGNGAGQSTNVLASQNVVIGHEAAKNSSGTIGTQTSVFNNNIAIGARSLKSAIISQSNVSIGSDNMSSSTQANRNTMIGSNVVNKYNGDDNVIIGAEMLFDTASNGSKNVIIGSVVAKNIRGSKNIILGYKAAYDSSFKNTNNKLIIANDSTRTPLIYGEFDNKKVTINGDFTITGKSNLNLSTDTTIKALKKTIDSLVAALSTKSVGKIDSSTLAKINPVIATKFLDSTFLPTINFDGNATHVALGKIDLLSQKIYNRTFTVESWIKSLKVSDTTQMIFCNGYQWNGNVGTFAMSLYKGRILATVGNFAGYSMSADFPKDSLWHHVVFTHNNTDKYSVIFIDGIEKYRINNLGVQGMVSGSQNLDGIGANLDGGYVAPREFFKGNLRKLRVSKGAVYTSNFSPSYTYIKADSTLAFWELNDLGTHIKANDSAYNGTLYNGAWLVPDTSSTNLNNGLLAYFPLDGNTKDSSTNKNDGVVTNNLVYVSNRFNESNKSIQLSSFNDIISTTNSISNPQPISYSFWFKTSTVGNFIGFNNGQKTHGGNWDRVAMLDSAGYINYYIYQAGEKFLKGNQSLKDNKWHHCVTNSSSTGVQIYIDGQLIAQESTYNSPQAYSGYFRIGGLQTGATIPALSSNVGLIDDVRIYNRVLNVNEITYLSTH